MEIFDILNKAKDISELINNPNDELDFTNENKDETFLNLVNIIQILKNFQSNSEEENFNDENNLNFGFSKFNANSLSKILPYFEFDHQKEVLFLLKFMEFKNLINSYKNVISTADIGEKGNVKKSMLLTIKPKLNVDKQPVIDIFLKFLEINEILTKMKLKESYNEF